MFRLCYNKNKVLYLTMTKDYKNFSKVADLAVERAKLKNVESPKFCETDIAKRRWLIHLLECGCVLRTVFERKRRSTVKLCWWTKSNVKSTKMKRSVGIM